jgi:hypothetical protein
MNIYQKLVDVRKAVPYLQKDAMMTQGQSGYKYNSSSQVIGAVRKKLDELNLLLITKIIDKRVHMDTIEFIDEKTKRPKRTTTFFTELDLMMVWVDCDDPSTTIEIPWYGQGIDTAGEKGVGKALTYAEKTFLLKEFNIATDQMDPDNFQERVENTTGRNAMLATNMIAQIKSEWQGAGGKINALNPWVEKNYGKRLIELTEDQATEIIGKIRAGKGGKAS